MPEKGPPVYLDYDQAALDAAYDQAAYAQSRVDSVGRAAGRVIILPDYA